MSAETPSAVIARTIAAITLPDEAATARAAERQGRLTKPPGSLGRLETLATRIAGITGDDRPRLERRLLVVAAADHGVAAQGVSAYPQAVTAQMVANFSAGGAAVNVLAEHAGARVHVVDAGIAEETPGTPATPGTPETPEAPGLTRLRLAPGLTRLRLAPGTDDITAGPAMSRELAERAVAAGIELFEAERAAAGVDIVGLGEMGIANSTSAAAIVAAVTGRPPRTVTGRGTGIDDQRFEAKVTAIERALEVNRPDRSDGIALLATIGGFEIGVLAGVYLAAAAAHVPAVVDGLISGAAALVAEAVEPVTRSHLIASHLSVEPGHGATLEHLGLEPLFDLGLRLGEGTGAALGITLCVAACRLLDEMATFGEAGVDGSDDVVAPEA